MARGHKNIVSQIHSSPPVLALEGTNSTEVVNSFPISWIAQINELYLKYCIKYFNCAGTIS